MSLLIINTCKATKYLNKKTQIVYFVVRHFGAFLYTVDLFTQGRGGGELTREVRGA
jgi:hypothetical protein